MKVWSQVPREMCIQETGKPPIKLRWVDINKGDGTTPVYRSRIVAKEINTHARPDLFTATPPLEYAKYLVSCAASRQGDERPCCILLHDIGKAYFHCSGHAARAYRAPARGQRSRHVWAAGEIPIRD